MSGPKVEFGCLVLSSQETRMPSSVEPYHNIWTKMGNSEHSVEAAEAVLLPKPRPFWWLRPEYHQRKLEVTQYTKYETYSQFWFFRLS